MRRRRPREKFKILTYQIMEWPVTQGPFECSTQEGDWVGGGGGGSAETILERSGLSGLLNVPPLAA